MLSRPVLLLMVGGIAGARWAAAQADAPEVELGEAAALPYAIVDTGQIRCYDDRTEITYPRAGRAFFGQDAQYEGNQPRYQSNGDGTVTDLVTGLMWQADPGPKASYEDAASGAAHCTHAGYDDWRMPTIKELYSLILFSGVDVDPRSSSGGKPFIDKRQFKFSYGRASDGDRIIDSQWATSSIYGGEVMFGQQAMFGVNFADGRIKGYPVGKNPRGREKLYYTIYVRGNPDYGKNDFVDNGDGTVTDRATGLMWMQVDSGKLKAGPKRDGKMNWQQALAWGEGLDYAGHSDWRLPNAKELQSIVDYSRSPDVTDSAAIDPILECTPIANEGGRKDYAFYWSSTSHTRSTSAEAGVYVAFGRALGFMSTPGSRSSSKRLLDVHGAGAQRSDPKSGDPSRVPTGRGPQGDVVRIYNMVRLVRGGVAEPRESGPAVKMKYDRQGPPEESGRGGPGAGPGGEGERPEGGPGGREGGKDGRGGGQDGRGGPPSSEQWVQRLDRDGDNRVSRTEFDGPSQHFTRFDQNGDGYITASEAPDGPPPGRQGQQGSQGRPGGRPPRR